MTNIPEQHKAYSPNSIRCAVITVSDSRTLETDSGGQVIIDLLQSANHTIVQREIIPDQPERMQPLLTGLRDRDDVDAILMTGGTGLSSRDFTYETVCNLFTKELPGYGELFRYLSFQEIGPAAILSRATAGLLNKTVVLTMPGSPAAVILAMEKIILPELSHIVGQARR